MSKASEAGVGRDHGSSVTGAIPKRSYINMKIIKIFTFNKNYD